MKCFFLWCMGPQVRKNCFLGFVKWFFPWSVAPPSRRAGGIPTSPLCPPDPPCAERGISSCLSTDKVRIGHALCMTPVPGHISPPGGTTVTAPCHHSRDKPAPKRRGRDQLRQAAFSPKANTRVAKRLGFHEVKANLEGDSGPPRDGREPSWARPCEASGAL